MIPPETNATVANEAPFTLAQMAEYMAAHFKTPQEHVVGLAVAPQTFDILTRSVKPVDSIHGPLGIPYIIDPRLGKGSEVFYDETAWRTRCAEQRYWDTQHS